MQQRRGSGSRHAVFQVCLPRMCHHVEPSRTQASYGSALCKATGRVAKGGCYALCDLSDRLPLLRSDENKQTNTESTELKLQMYKRSSLLIKTRAAAFSLSQQECGVVCGEACAKKRARSWHCCVSVSS